MTVVWDGLCQTSRDTPVTTDTTVLVTCKVKVKVAGHLYSASTQVKCSTPELLRHGSHSCYTAKRTILAFTT